MRISGPHLQLLWKLGTRVRVHFPCIIKVTVGPFAARFRDRHRVVTMHILKPTRIFKRLFQRTSHTFQQALRMTLTKMHGLLATTIAICLSSTACYPDADVPPDRLAVLTGTEDHTRLESAIPALMESGGVTGLSIAITADTGIVWSRERAMNETT